MKTKHTLESSDLKLIAAAAEAEALKNNWAVSIAIVDDAPQDLALSGGELHAGPMVAASSAVTSPRPRRRLRR